MSEFQWIRVDKQAPKKGSTVLAAYTFTIKELPTEFTVLEYRGEDDWMSGDVGGCSDPTFWAYIPKLPKARKQSSRRQ